jgi:uncharacterized flavoprotein (TIGR03862 family)
MPHQDPPPRPADFAARHVWIIGGGPAGLMAAETVAQAGHRVSIVEHMPSVGRKLMMAGRGGLNITHAEDFPQLLQRYGQATPHLQAALGAFPPAWLIAWCEGLGQPVFTGSSRRVFPTSLKASPLLRAWLARLADLGVTIRTRTRWLGWTAGGDLRLAGPDGETSIAADATILALGGASWPRLGADGSWTSLFPDRAINPLLPANCAFTTAWSPTFRDRFQGHPLKRIGLRFGDHQVRGEAMITDGGIEGGAVYALAAVLRDAIARDGQATLKIDLRPDLDEAGLARRLAAPRRSQSLSTYLRKTVGLPPVAVGLLQEALHGPSARTPLTTLIKAVPVDLLAPTSLARAISTAGGLRFDSLTDSFMLRDRPGTFAAGEMLDWEAPTGGYLLQATLSTGAAAGRGAVRWLDPSEASKAGLSLRGPFHATKPSSGTLGHLRPDPQRGRAPLIPET